MTMDVTAYLAVLPVWAEQPVAALAIFVAFYVVGRVVVKPFAARVGRQRSEHIAKPVGRAAFYLTVVLGVLTALSGAGYGRTLTAFSAIAAAGTFALGFAMQDTLSAFISGVFIFVDKPFQIGDWVEFEEFEGTVEDITLRTTKIETFNNELLTVPNDRIANAVVKNPVANEQLRVTMTVGIGYDDDIEEAKQVLDDIATEAPGVAQDPEPTVRLVNLGESTVDLKLLYWVNKPRRAKFMQVKERILKQVKEQFDERGIDMPYPTQTIAGDSLTVRQE